MMQGRTTISSPAPSHSQMPGVAGREARIRAQGRLRARPRAAGGLALVAGGSDEPALCNGP